MFIEDKKESEDTSEKEDEKEDEEDSTQDTSKEDSDKKEQEESDKEITSDEDITKQYFADPKSLPKEVQGAFKRMQATYTRKMQALSAVADKAEAFDTLYQDQQFRDWLEARRNGTLSKSSKKAKEDSEDDDEDDKPLTRKQLREEFNSLQKESEKKEAYRTMERQAVEFKKTHPDYKIYETGMLELISKIPGLSYAQAYKLAKEDGDDEETLEEKVKERKKANITKPNKTGASEAEGKKKSPTVKDAFELARQMLRKGV